MGVLAVQRRDPVAVVSLNRPEARNAPNLELVVSLARVWEELAADDSVWVVVSIATATATADTVEGPRAFLEKRSTRFERC